ncbi:metallophosphoesterase [Staphylococcus caprae]|uniref:Phosphohydrolase n=2 Tax=Staphylococcus caprae TaxID=29380 RepID=A0ABM7FNJ7_9STAP|nr:metallophosphoesterase [Staphylococcus caprae]EES41800.1 putative phosphoesterase [Staphylococcus caprae M23864:W1]MBN6826203.1 metallophosphoesterase [Staphylococcus caprae]MBX5323597.1 phosphohydrolase [Staphylococcus caprae]MDI0014433.1 metallophosphoesterase [Staphylococcus caprae]MEB8095175.1 metallophosphoesterase [Staphylococcus caprae]
MKIGAISDLHVDRHPKLEQDEYLNVLSQVIQHRKLDILLIAGDISNDYQMSYHFIKQLKDNINIPTYFIPGNHDLWSDDSDKTSTEILDYYKSKEECLIGRPFIINDEWAIVGNTGWYDYSYADTRFTQDKIQKGKHYGATWQDKVRMDWSLSDQQLSKIAANKVEEDIKQVCNRNIILMTHIVTHPQFVVPTPHRIFDFFNAFIGTHDFDAIYEAYPIKYSIMGHVHFRKEIKENGITYLCPCLGYQRQWRTPDMVMEMNHALVDFDI